MPYTPSMHDVSFINAGGLKKEIGLNQWDRFAVEGHYLWVFGLGNGYDGISCSYSSKAMAHHHRLGRDHII